MFKSKRADRSRKRRRTSLEIEEEQNRTLYIRLPHTIKNTDEIKSLFFGDFKVKLPRQSSRYCHVIFSDLEEKMKNLKAVKKNLINGKPIFVGPPKPINLEKKKKPKQKKIVLPDPTVQSKTGKYLFVSNIPPGIKASEVKDAFPGSVTVALLKGLVNGKRNAKLKMTSPQICLHYAQNKDNWPVLKEHKVSVSLSKKKGNRKNKIKEQNKTDSLKIYDGESEQKGESQVKDNNTRNEDTDESNEEDDNEKEDNEDREVESSSEEE